MNAVPVQTKRVTLDKVLLICWYLTVFASPFGVCLLGFELPIGGHFFLFRGMILLTCAVYLFYLIRRRENPLRGLSWPERWFVVLAVCMLGYGAVSALRAISLGAWFTKFFTMCQMLAMVFLFLKLCRDPKILRNTMLVIALTSLIFLIVGVVELFHGPFFDTLCIYPSYVFFKRWLYVPVFSMYNPNGFTVHVLFALEVLNLYLALRWDTLSPRLRKWSYWLLAGGLTLMLFLCCAAGGRLSILAMPLIVAGIAGWALLRYRKGLLLFLLLALMLGFIYVGENYAQVQYKVEEVKYRIEEVLHPGTERTDEDKPEAPAEPDKNYRATLYTIVPSITGENVNESLTESDGVRLTLLKNSLQMIMESKGLGIGLGNVESRMEQFGNTQGIVNVHCFIVELVVEFGVFVLIPLLLLVLSILRRVFAGLYHAVKSKDRTAFANLFLLLMMTAAFPLLSTANSSSWGIVIMWMYLATVLLLTDLWAGNVGQIGRRAEASSKRSPSHE